MDVTIGSVRQARFHQDRVGHSRVELLPEVTRHLPTKKRRGVAENDRRCVQRANDHACGRRLRINQHRGNRVGKLSRFAASLDVAPKADGATKIIAGGRSLGPMLNLRLVEPDLLVDISGLCDG